MNWRFPSWYLLTPAEVISARLGRVGAMCGAAGLDGMLLTDAYDVFYASGTSQQGVALVLPDGGCMLMIRRYAPRAEAESPLMVTPISGLSQAGEIVAKALGSGARLGLAMDVLPAADYLGWQKRLAGLELIDATGPWLDLKAVKDAWELERMAAAGKLGAKIYAALPEIIKPGMTEAELAGRMQAIAIAGGSIDYLRSRRAYHQTYSWHISSGPEGNLPSAMDAPFNGWGLSPAFPMGACHNKLAPGHPINVDFGLSLDGYQTDQTRTFCLGPAPVEVKAAHACLEDVRAAFLEGLTPGAVSGELFELGVEIAERHGLGQEYLGRGSGHGIRFAAHGAGQELGTPPYILENSRAVVRAGETYALELKMLTQAGPVGLEDTVAVEPQGPARTLTPQPPELIEIAL